MFPRYAGLAHRGATASCAKTPRSFSVFVSNLDFRVPSLRQIGERTLTRGRAAAEKRPPERLAIWDNIVASHDPETRFFGIINPVSGGVFLSE